MGTIYEKPNSPEIVSAKQGSSVRREYHLEGYNAVNDALVALGSTAPTYATVDGYLLGSVDYSLSNVDGIHIYTGVVDYKHTSREKNDGEELETSGDEKVSFDFGGSMVTRTHVVEGGTQQEFGADAKEMNGLINVLDDSTVNGVEVGFPTGSFSVTTLIANATVTNTWLKARYAQLYTLNNATFRTLASGDCLFTGISGQKRDTDDWEITYKFDVSISEALTDVAGIAVDTTKTGFQYLWVMTKPNVQSNVVVPTALGVYIADIYKKSDFSQLGIAT